MVGGYKLLPSCIIITTHYVYLRSRWENSHPDPPRFQIPPPVSGGASDLDKGAGLAEQYD